MSSGGHRSEENVSITSGDVDAMLLQETERIHLGERESAVAVPVPEHAGGVEELQELRSESEEDVKEKERELKKQKWTGLETINRRYWGSLAKVMSLDSLTFDVHQVHGQTRPIDPVHVKNLMESLTIRPPNHLLRISAWDCVTDRKMYIVSGQHLMRAVMNLRQEREEKGLQVPRWMKNVEVDVLRFETPLSDRRIYAGAMNASTKVARQSTVAECVRLYQTLAVDTELDFNQRVVKAVEMSGLNTPGTNPVCCSSMLDREKLPL